MVLCTNLPHRRTVPPSKIVRRTHREVVRTFLCSSLAAEIASLSGLQELICSFRQIYVTQGGDASQTFHRRQMGRSDLSQEALESVIDGPGSAPPP